MSYTVTLKGGSPWGFRFQGGCDFHEPIKVAKINSNSKAYKEGLKVGDIIDAINGQKTAGLLHNDVQQLIKCATKELVLDLTSHTPMMNGQMNGDIHPIEEQIITGKTSKDDYKPMSYNTTQTLTTTTDSYSTSSRPGVTSTSSVKVNVSPYRDKGVSDSTSSTLTAHSVPQEEHHIPIMKEQAAVEEHIIPISVKRERMIPLTIQTSGSDLKNFPQEETRSRDSGITSRGSSWQSGSFKDGNFSPGSYATLPIRKSSSERGMDRENDDYDFSAYRTLPTIKPLKTKRGYNECDMDFERRGREDVRIRSQKKPIVVPQDGYSTDVDFCVRNNRRNNQDYSQGNRYNQRDYIHDMDLDSFKLPQKAKLYDQRGFVSEFDLSSLDSQPEMQKYSQWPPQPHRQQSEYHQPPQQADSDFQRRHSESTWNPPNKYVPPSHQENKPAYTKWTPKHSPSITRKHGSFDASPSSGSPTRGRYIPVQVVHEGRQQDPGNRHRVGQKNEEDKPSHEIQSTMNGSHISSNYSPTKSNQSLHEQSSPQRLTSHADKPVISNVAPIWNPKKGAIFQKKEYKPIKLDTLGMSTMEIQKQHEENQKQEELNIIPPPPEESYSCQQPENEELHEFKSFVSYTPQSNVSDTPQTSRDHSDQAPPEQPPHYHPDPPQKDYMFSNGEFDSEEPSRLPPTQSPFVTLLRKGRENGFPVDLKDIKNVDEPLIVLTEGQLPKGAVYIGEQDTLEDGVKHTDTFYAVPTTEEDMSLQSPTSPSEKKPLKYDGIGPTDDKGMPLSFRMNVDEKNQHEWYKQMYRSLHTTKKKEVDRRRTLPESNSYKPTYEFPERKVEPKPKEDVQKPVVEETVTKENPYKPSYELPSTYREDSSKFRVSEKNKQNDRLSSTQREKITKSDFNQRKEQFTGKKDIEAGYRSEPDNSSKLKSRTKSLSDFKADFKSSSKPKSFEWNPPNARSTVEKYRCQPRSIVDYEPGFSSIAFQEAKVGAVHNPPIDKPGQFSRYTEGGRTRLTSEPADSKSEEDPNSADLYKLVQQGGDIPIRGLQKPGPEKQKKQQASQQQQQQQSPLSPPPPKVPPPPKLSPWQQPIIKSSTSYNQLYSKFESGQQGNSNTNRIGNEPPNPPVRQLKSAPVTKLRIRSNLSAAEQLGVKSSSPKVNGAFKFQTSDVRKSPTERVQRRREDEEDYRRKRLEQISEEGRRRKIEQERADIESRKHSDFFQEVFHDPSQKSPIPVDRFEEPITGYNTVPADRRRGFKIHGKAKALYNFNAQNPRELSFRKGDVIFLLKQIDKNWFEGERYGRSGIFPVNYVEVLTSIEEAHTAAQQAEGQARIKYNFNAQTGVELSLRKGDIVTLLRSIDENWFEGRVGNKQGIFPRSYVEVIFDPSTPLVTPAPSVITTPMTGRGTPEMLSPSGYDAPTPPPQPSPRAFSPRSPAIQHHQRQPGFSPQQQGLNSHQQGFSPQRANVNYTSPRYDAPHERLEGSPAAARLNGYSQYNGDYNNVSISQNQGRQRQSPTVGRKQFVSNGPSYPPSANTNSNIETNNNFDFRNKVPDDDLALCRYRAVYAYRPQNDDELELLEGDEVYVMEKCDDGWYVGTSNRTAMFGTFPGNYVQLIQ